MALLSPDKVMEENRDEQVDQGLLERNKDTDVEKGVEEPSVEAISKNKRLKIGLIATGFVAAVLLGIVIGIYVERRTKISFVSQSLPALNQAHFVLQNEKQNRDKILQGKYIKDWVVESQSGDSDILFGPDEHGVFTVSKSGFYDIAVQVVFHNTNPLNMVKILIDGEEWISSPHSAPLQLGNPGNTLETVTTPIAVSSIRFLSEGTRLTISLGYTGMQISTLPKHTFFDIVERR